MSHLNLKFTKEEDEIWGKKIEATSTLVQGFPVETLVVKNLPANAGDTRDSGSIPGSEDPLEDRASHPSIPAWTAPGTEEPRRQATVQGATERPARLKRLNTRTHPHQSSASLSPRKASREHGLFHMSKSCKDDCRKTLLNLSAVKQTPEWNKNRYFET